MIVLPGLVDTHSHLWNRLLRGVVDPAAPGRGYFDVKCRVAEHYRPEDSYAAARLGRAEALNFRTTTVCEGDHSARSPDDVAAKLRAHRHSGLRTHCACGNPDNDSRDRAMDLDDVARVPRDEVGGRLIPGVALRGPARTEPDVLRMEWERARELGIPITLHLGGKRENAARGRRGGDAIARRGPGTGRMERSLRCTGSCSTMARFWREGA